MTDEIDNTMDVRSRLSGIVSKISKWLEQNDLLNVNRMLSTLSNATLLFGNENSIGVRALYDQVQEAAVKKGAIENEFNEQYNPSGKGWSAFMDQENRIADIDGKELAVEVAGQNQKVKLTDAELITLYLMHRQNEKALFGGPSPREQLIGSGFRLEQNEIKDRNFSRSDAFKLADYDNQMIEIERYIAKKHPKIVRQIDGAFSVMRPHLNETFRSLHGSDLDEVANYFPVYSGKEQNMDQDSYRLFEGLRNNRTRVGSSDPMMIKDVNKVMQISKQTISHYAATATVSHNLDKLFRSVSENYNKDTTPNRYLNQVQGMINRTLDPTLRWNNNQDKKWDRLLKNFSSNFAISVLGMNMSVMFKQMVSLNTAAIYIDRKYLNESAVGTRGITLAPLQELTKWLEWNPKGVLGDKGALIPLQWSFPDNNPQMKLMMKHSGLAATRFEGINNREAEDSIEAEKRGKDMIHFNLGKKRFHISKHRLMMGIQAVDTLTVMKLWNAVESETKDLHPNLVPGTDEYYDHVAKRWEYLTEMTQPSTNSINRVDLHSSKHPVVRFMTMFGSATSKIGEAIIMESAKTVANPTSENKNRLGKALINTVMIQPILLTAIDLLVRGIEGFGWDDDEIEEYAIPKMMGYATGMFFGVRDVASTVIGQVYDKPWLMETTVPPIDAFEQFRTATAMMIQGYGKGEYGGEQWLYDDALKSYFELFLKTTGLPLKPMMTYRRMNKRLSSASSNTSGDSKESSGLKSLIDQAKKDSNTFFMPWEIIGLSSSEIDQLNKHLNPMYKIQI